MTRVTIVPDAEAAARRAADVMANHINDARMHKHGGDVHVALAGGSTPKRAYELLAEMQGSWAGVHVWLGDERCVPSGHPDSTVAMIEETLVRHVRTPRGPVVHPVRGELEPEDAAWLYGNEVVRAMGEEPTLDLVLLGLGEDGHTASLFPGSPVVDNRYAPVLPIRNSPKPPPSRVTLSLPVLRRARFLMLLATGEGKREALARMRAGDPELPTGRLFDALDELVCDVAAAGEA